MVHAASTFNPYCLYLPTQACGDPPTPSEQLRDAGVHKAVSEKQLTLKPIMK